MSTDSINEEIRAIRRALAAKFDNDLARISADLRQRQAVDGRTYTQLPPRPARKNIVQHQVAQGANDGEDSSIATSRRCE